VVAGGVNGKLATLSQHAPQNQEYDNGADESAAKPLGTCASQKSPE